MRCAANSAENNFCLHRASYSARVLALDICEIPQEPCIANRDFNDTAKFFADPINFRDLEKW